MASPTSSCGRSRPPRPDPDWRTALRGQVLAARAVDGPSPVGAGIAHRAGHRRAGGRSTGSRPSLRCSSVPGSPIDLAHHSLHVLSSRIFGFSQDLFDDSPRGREPGPMPPMDLYPNVGRMAQGREPRGRARLLRRRRGVRVRPGPDPRRAGAAPRLIAQSGDEPRLPVMAGLPARCQRPPIVDRWPLLTSICGTASPPESAELSPDGSRRIHRAVDVHVIRGRIGEDRSGQSIGGDAATRLVGAGERPRERVGRRRPPERRPARDGCAPRRQFRRCCSSVSGSRRCPGSGPRSGTRPPRPLPQSSAGPRSPSPPDAGQRGRKAVPRPGGRHEGQGYGEQERERPRALGLDAGSFHSAASFGRVPRRCVLDALARFPHRRISAGC